MRAFSWRLTPMAATIRSAVITIVLWGTARLCCGQGLVPRAYVITSTHSNAVTVTYQLQDGNIVFDPSLPIADSKGRISSSLLSYYHSFSFFGRSANFTATVPYAVGHFQGVVSGMPVKVYRSGLAPTIFRFSVNLAGGPAMEPQDYAKWRQKRLIGASLIVSPPTGQYDGSRLFNTGSNRWAFRPEVGLSRRWGNWIFDAYGAVWFFTPNNDFFSNAPGSHGPNRQTQAPMGATELHLSYNVRPRFWVSLDGNYWYGGKTSLNGVVTPTTLQSNSRIGVTASIPVSKHQSIKASYSDGTFVHFGGDYQSVSVGWQYSWLHRPS
jgi:hypothetical protein